MQAVRWHRFSVGSGSRKNLVRSGSSLAPQADWKCWPKKYGCQSWLDLIIACWTEVDAASNNSSQTSAVAGGLARFLTCSSNASDSEESVESELLVEDESDDSMTPASIRVGSVPTGSLWLASKVKHRQACDPDAFRKNSICTLGSVRGCWEPRCCGVINLPPLRTWSISLVWNDNWPWTSSREYTLKLRLELWRWWPWRSRSSWDTCPDAIIWEPHESNVDFIECAVQCCEDCCCVFQGRLVIRRIQCSPSAYVMGIESRRSTWNLASQVTTSSKHTIQIYWLLSDTTILLKRVGGLKHWLQNRKSALSKPFSPKPSFIQTLWDASVQKHQNQILLPIPCFWSNRLASQHSTESAQKHRNPLFPQKKPQPIWRALY